MSDIHGPKETTAVAHFCPRCGSASISGSSTVVLLSESKVRCEACGWSGSRDMLAAVPFSHELGGQEDIVKALMADLRGTIAREAGPSFAGFLMKWGFMPTPDPTLLARYLAAIARATLGAIIKERAEIDKERVSGN